MPDLGGGFSSKASKEKEGVVYECLPALTFRVRLNSGEEILAHLAGKMRLNHIVVLSGDRVLVEVGPDGKRGRIVRRL